MTNAQGINKILAYARQTSLGTPKTGSGGQKLRRRTSTFNAPIDTYESDEIVSHQQSTGVGIGGKKPGGKIDALASAGTYADLLASLLRRDFAAVTALSGLSITIAGTGPTYTLTRGAGSFLTDGVKIGHVVRLTAGGFNAANLNVNLLVTAIGSATALTVKPLNGKSLIPEGPIASATLSIPGKVTFAPPSGHTNVYYTFEEYYADLGKSALFTDCQVAKADFSLPATGNVGLSLEVVGLNRTIGASQVLTSPAAETTTSVMAAVNGVVLVGGASYPITGASIAIDGTVTQSDMEVGSTVSSDTQRGRIKVTGSFTAKLNSLALQAIKEAGAAVQMILVVTEDQTDNANFIGFTINALKLTSDDVDDGEKALVGTYNFTAQYNSGGGAGQATEQTILQLQDSNA